MEDLNPIFSVSEFIEYINITFKGRIFRVRGEIANAKISPSGHAYFDLKDSETGKHLLQCWVWKFRLPKFRHLLENGFEVIVSGEAKLWEGGKFSFIGESIEPIGEGALRKAFEELKKTLAKKGYFEESRKRPIPEFVRTIGLITSTHGAVIEDFKRNIGKHGFTIVIADARVEGDEAEGSIVEALRVLNLEGKNLDVIVLIRGGGSFESFKAFNSEVVAEAIIASRVPVLTGIGHEPDETIAGLVSDMDCSTPTAVAEFLNRGYDRLWQTVVLKSNRLEASLDTLFSENARNIRTRIDAMTGVFRRVFDKFHEYENRVTSAGIRFIDQFHFLHTKLETAELHLKNLNPQNVLERGYAVVSTTQKGAVKDANALRVGDEISVRFAKGRVESKVEKIEL